MREYREGFQTGSGSQPVALAVSVPDTGHSLAGQDQVLGLPVMLTSA